MRAAVTPTSSVIARERGRSSNRERAWLAHGVEHPAFVTTGCPAFARHDGAVVVAVRP